MPGVYQLADFATSGQLAVGTQEFPAQYEDSRQDTAQLVLAHTLPLPLSSSVALAVGTLLQIPLDLCSANLLSPKEP